MAQHRPTDALVGVACVQHSTNPLKGGVVPCRLRLRVGAHRLLCECVSMAAHAVAVGQIYFRSKFTGSWLRSSDGVMPRIRASPPACLHVALGCSVRRAPPKMAPRAPPRPPT